MNEEVDFNQLCSEVRYGTNMDLTLKPESAFALAGLVQLALTHPDIRAHHAAEGVGRAFVAAVKEHFAYYPTVLRVLEMGDRPGHDLPANGQETGG